MPGLLPTIEYFDLEIDTLNKRIKTVYDRDLDHNLAALPLILADTVDLMEKAHSIEQAIILLPELVFFDLIQKLKKDRAWILETEIPGAKKRLNRCESEIRRQQQQVAEIQQELNVFIQAKTKLVNADV